MWQMELKLDIRLPAEYYIDNLYIDGLYIESLYNETVNDQRTVSSESALQAEERMVQNGCGKEPDFRKYLHAAVTAAVGKGYVRI